MPDLEIQPGVIVPDDAIAFQAVRASGPGGQNVNKVSSKVVLRVDVDRIQGLSQPARDRLRNLAGSRWIEGDALLITASETRNQLENRSLAEAKLIDLIRRALIPPTPRRRTRPTKASKERRLAGKQLRAKIKQGRTSPSDGLD